MNCSDFYKNIDSYLNDRLTDEELNDFLHHLSSCDKCRNELEINYIVAESANMDSKKKIDLNFIRSFNNNISRSDRKIRGIKFLRLLSYIVNSVVFWVLLAVIIVFFRVNSL